MSQTPGDNPQRRSGPVAGTPSPFTAEQMREIQLGQQRLQKITRAATVSRIDGGIMAVFAFGALASFCFGLSGVILGVALGIVSFNSFRGAERLKRMDPTAPGFLAINQLFLAAAVILYALYNLHAGLTAPQSDIASELGGFGGSSLKDLAGGDLDRVICWVLYVGLIVGTVIAQGLAAIYYGSRTKFLKAYVAETPQWVVDFQKAQSG